MQPEFYTYFNIGFNHITTLDAIDHILFLITLCAIYSLKEWKHVAFLVTAFTFGHSISLALSVFNIISFPTRFIELLIPFTIILSSIFNIFIWRKSKKIYSSSTPTDNQRKTKVSSPSSPKNNLNYFLALTFGLIHGMGFSNILKSMFMPDESILKPLLSFNLGIEIGQLLIVFFILFIAFIFLNILKTKQQTWILVISGITGIWAVYLFFEQLI